MKTSKYKIMKNIATREIYWDLHKLALSVTHISNFIPTCVGDISRNLVFKYDKDLY